MSRVGITYNPSIDLLSSGSNQTAILLYELFSALNYKVTLLNVKSDDTDWWADFPKYNNVTLSSVYKVKDLDLLIDIDAVVDSNYRKKVAKKTVAFLRTFLQFDEMDRTVYPEATTTYRNFDNVSEIWCWDLLNPENTIPSIQTLFSCPIRCVPFIWSATIADNYFKKYDSQHDADSKWTIHISEKNSNNSSSSILSLVAVRELFLKGTINAQYKCHNMERILDNKFLKENILNNIEVSKLPLAFVKSEIFTNWSNNHILFSHSRFTPLRIGLLNALWAGIPVIHNSPIIKDLHPVLADMFYFGNEITNICRAFDSFTSNYESYYQVHNQIKANIIDKWSIHSNLDKWTVILDNIVTGVKILVSDKVDKDTVEMEQKELIVAFSDMWPGFNYDDNFFINMIRHECKFRNITVKGVKYTDSVKANVLLCGPFSSGWEHIHIPKIYITAENWAVPNDDTISLYLTPSRTEDETHMRLPTWMTFIDWYSESDDVLSVNTDNNPNLLPVKLAMTVHPKKFSNRDEFCGFVVSNPVCQFRNEAFFLLNSYKKVNSGGELYNNIGGRLNLKYPGGGCGDIPKLKFFENHKFTLCFENSQAPGYITEKVLHSKMGGCVPIYWGDIDTNSDFVPNSFINVSQYNKSEDIVEIIKKLEANPEICEKIASTPILNEEKKQKAMYTLSKIAKRILKIALNDSTKKEIVERDTNTVPIKGIDKIYVVNLDKRQDRFNSLIEAEPYLKDVIERIPAIDGKTLRLNKFIYKLFEHNTFGWKKSVMGCSLSHMKIWSNIIKESGNMTLVLEDDVRFNKDWISICNKSISNIPNDADILYIGGVLPPNKAALPLCLNKINEYWSDIIPNTFFSSQSNPIFHFCTYSYIITKKGAEKLLQYLKISNIKSFAAVDHLLGSPEVNLKKYVSNTLLAYCFQDNDPNYINSVFNSTDIIKKYDSDIVNNTEYFTETELMPFKLEQIDLYYFDETIQHYIYEEKWLTSIFETKINLKQITNLNESVPDNSWFIVQRPHFNKIIPYFKYLQQHNINFKVLHLSDEYFTDPIDFYSFSNCKCVIRNYTRSDVTGSHILTIPLGFHHKGAKNKLFSDRKFVWSFHGTNWFNRQEQLYNILDITPNVCHLTDKWDDPNQSKESYYLDTLENSKFCPILRGNNYETFRLYEALEVGTIPIYVRCNGDELFWQFISKLGLININSWDTAKQIMEQFLNNPTDAENYKNTIYNNWLEWKKEIGVVIDNMK